MAIRLIAVGKIGTGHLRGAADEYAKRIRRYLKLEIVEVPDESLRARSRAEIQRLEDERILAVLPLKAHVFLADSQGRRLTSEQFAGRLNGLLLSGKSDIAFVVGGTLGVGERVRARADETLSFSQMTMAHGLARVVLLEQIYRAFTIMRGEKYHR